jgi:hypothetical protein
MKKKLLLLVLLSVLVLSCTQSKKSDGDLEIYAVTDSIKLNRPTRLLDFIVTEEHFIGVDDYDTQLVLLSRDGKRLASFGNKGRGPKEFSDPKFISIYNNIIGINDHVLNKNVLVRYDINNEKIVYNNEFRLPYALIDISILKEDKILISLFGDENNIKLFDFSGNIIEEFSFMENDLSEDLESFFDSSFFIGKINSEYFLLAGVVTGKLYFCQFNHKKNSIAVISEQIVEDFDKLGDTYHQIGDDAIQTYGLGLIYTFNNHYYISFDPTSEAIEESFFQRYDKYGNYLGKTVIKDELEYFFAFYEDEIYFMRLLEGNDEMIYVAKEIEK